MKNSSKILCFLAALMFVGCGKKTEEVTNIDKNDGSKVIVAYVTSWTGIIPDPQHMTHINYSFGHVTDGFDGVRIDNPNRLIQLVNLKKDAPHLKVMLSVGGWGSGRFSEMAADKDNRKAFAQDCRRVIDKYGLDGIDIDWEYPTSSAAKISSSPDDTKNFTLLMRDIRAAIGGDKWLTLASSAMAKYIDFAAIEPYMDFVNIMTYDMSFEDKFHCALYPSEHTPELTAAASVDAHILGGMPPEKLVLGVPFYGRGPGRGMNYKKIAAVLAAGEFEEQWDDNAQQPYLVGADGKFYLGYDNPRSLKIKCDYIKAKGLRGVMYWEYSGDTDASDLRLTLRNNL